MLSLLPPELLRDIIEAAVPHTFHTTTYQERQDTLCSLSLVSKPFLAIAQPLLLEIVWVKSLEKADHLFLCGGGGNARGNQIRCAIIQIPEDNEKNRLSQDGRFQEHDIEDIMNAFESASSLTVSHRLLLSLDLHFICDFHHLLHLQISGTYWDWGFDPEDPDPLVDLQSLALHDMDRTGDLLDPLLHTDILPKLRQFGLNSSSVCSLGFPNFKSLLPQLESLNFTASAWMQPNADFLRVKASSTLIDCHTDDLESVLEVALQFIHIRIINLLSDTWSDDLYGPLSDFSEELEKKGRSLPLKSIYLDSSLQPTLSLRPRIRSFIKELVAICQGCEIDVIFEAVPEEPDIDSPFSLEFSGRQRKIRRHEG